ncbi:hypothetical protein [Pectobacterium sp. CHL-2024]
MPDNVAIGLLDYAHRLRASAMLPLPAELTQPVLVPLPPTAD